MRQIFRVLLFVVLSGAIVPSAVSAQAPTVERLLLRIDSLERRIADLERRIAALEPKAAASADAPVENLPGSSRDIATWRRLREGMSYDQVRRLLGEPVRITGGTFAVWYYPREGEVGFFDGRVNRWQEPSR